MDIAEHTNPQVKCTLQTIATPDRNLNLLYFLALLYGGEAMARSRYDSLIQLGKKAKLPKNPQDAKLERLRNPHPDTACLIRPTLLIDGSSKASR